MDRQIKKYIRDNGIESCGRFYGVYVGIVKDITDTKHDNRILVNVPEVYGDTSLVRIALPSFGVMGKNYGTHFLPRVGGNVSVTFKQGDPDFPYWTPGPYHNEQAPKEFVGSEIFGFKSRNGHMVVIDDENNYITIQHKDGYYLELKEDKVTLGSEVRVEINDEAILLGKKTQENGLEPAVLGDTLKEWLTSCVDFIAAGLMTVDAKPVGPTDGPLATSPQVIKLKLDLDKILAKFPS